MSNTPTDEPTTITNEQFWKNTREGALTEETNEHGDTVWTMFVPDADRYLFDFKHCTARDGWRQFDTDQDAWYFGMWIHDKRRHVVMFAEGDLVVTECVDHDHFIAHLERLHACHGDPPPAAVAIGEDGQVTEFYDENARALP